MCNMFLVIIDVDVSYPMVGLVWVIDIIILLYKKTKQESILLLGVKKGEFEMTTKLNESINGQIRINQPRSRILLPRWSYSIGYLVLPISLGCVRIL